VDTRITSTTPIVGDLRPLVASWLRHLRAANLTPKTIHTYGQSAESLARFLETKGMPTRGSLRPPGRYWSCGRSWPPALARPSRTAETRPCYCS
jgi:hypothetical protein